MKIVNKQSLQKIENNTTYNGCTFHFVVYFRCLFRISRLKLQSITGLPKGLEHLRSLKKLILVGNPIDEEQQRIIRETFAQDCVIVFD
ncbi:hypothetical protein [Candidatus Uabimicrobium sp. HlEnr_7]|uniref:hypothetical protein n=1 Tax=Candidatus Uabimicrobium helgolandensis TaxID=3095367 RepID=UPI003558B2FF